MRYYHEVGRALTEHWGWDSDDSNLIRERTTEEKMLCVLCAVLKELGELKALLLNPCERAEDRKKAKEKARYRARVAAEEARRRSLAESRREWFLPVADRLLDELPAGEVVDKLRRHIHRDTWEAWPGAFPRYVAALKGPPYQWDVTVFYGLGPVFAAEWRKTMASNKASACAMKKVRQQIQKPKPPTNQENSDDGNEREEKGHCGND